MIDLGSRLISLSVFNGLGMAAEGNLKAATSAAELHDLIISSDVYEFSGILTFFDLQLTMPIMCCHFMGWK